MTRASPSITHTYLSLHFAAFFAWIKQCTCRSQAGRDRTLLPRRFCICGHHHFCTAAALTFIFQRTCIFIYICKDMYMHETPELQHSCGSAHMQFYWHLEKNICTLLNILPSFIGGRSTNYRARMQAAAIGFRHYHQRMPFGWNRTIPFKGSAGQLQAFHCQHTSCQKNRSEPPGSVQGFKTRNDTAHRIRPEDLIPRSEVRTPTSRDCHRSRLT